MKQTAFLTFWRTVNGALEAAGLAVMHLGAVHHSFAAGLTAAQTISAEIALAGREG